MTTVNSGTVAGFAIGIALFSIGTLALALAALRLHAEIGVASRRQSTPLPRFVPPSPVLVQGYDTGGLDDTYNAGGRGAFEHYWDGSPRGSGGLGTGTSFGDIPLRGLSRQSSGFGGGGARAALEEVGVPSASLSSRHFAQQPAVRGKQLDAVYEHMVQPKQLWRWGFGAVDPPVVAPPPPPLGPLPPGPNPRLPSPHLPPLGPSPWPEAAFGRAPRMPAQAWQAGRPGFLPGLERDPYGEEYPPEYYPPGYGPPRYPRYPPPAPYGPPYAPHGYGRGQAHPGERYGRYPPPPGYEEEEDEYEEYGGAPPYGYEQGRWQAAPPPPPPQPSVPWRSAPPPQPSVPWRSPPPEMYEPSSAGYGRSRGYPPASPGRRWEGPPSQGRWREGPRGAQPPTPGRDRTPPAWETYRPPRPATPPPEPVSLTAKVAAERERMASEGRRGEPSGFDFPQFRPL